MLGTISPQKAEPCFSLYGMHTIRIHKFAGCGEQWFLSCNPLGIEAWDLHTDDFDVAVKQTQNIIAERLKQLTEAYSTFTVDDSENTFTIGP